MIGRAQETPGIVEAELLSCTSETTAELFKEGGIARVFGEPRILEVMVEPGTDPKAKVIGTFEEIGSQIWRKTKGPDQDEGDGGPGLPYHRPNLSLNVGITRCPPAATYSAAVFGFLVEIGMLAFAGVTAYTKETDRFNTNGRRAEDYAFPLVVSGTILVSIGMFFCAHIIDRSTDETHYELINESEPCRIYWVQPGRQRIGDQVFGSCIGYSENPYYVRSTRANRNKAGEWGLLLLAVTTSIAGFGLEFIGLGAMHASVTLYQLVMTIVMAFVRSSLRAGRLAGLRNVLWPNSSNGRGPRNHPFLRNPKLLDGHELDLMTLHLFKIDTLNVRVFHDDKSEQIQAGDQSPDTAEPVEPSDGTGSAPPEAESQSTGASRLAEVEAQYIDDTMDGTELEVLKPRNPSPDATKPAEAEPQLPAATEPERAEPQIPAATEPEGAEPQIPAASESEEIGTQSANAGEQSETGPRSTGTGEQAESGSGSTGTGEPAEAEVQPSRGPVGVRARLADITGRGEGPSWEELETRVFAKRLSAVIGGTMGVLSRIPGSPLSTDDRFEWSIILDIVPLLARSNRSVLWDDQQIDPAANVIEHERLDLCVEKRANMLWIADPLKLEAVIGLWALSILLLDIRDQKHQNAIINYRIVSTPQDDSDSAEYDGYLEIFEMLQPRWTKLQRNGLISRDGDQLVDTHIFGRLDAPPKNTSGVDSSLDPVDSMKEFSIKTCNTTIKMCAHDIFMFFLYDTLRRIQNNLRETNTRLQAGDDEAARVLGLEESTILQMAECFVNNSLGTRADACMCIIPVLQKLGEMPARNS
ncbi:hypothetical protein Dda_0194 [Drechslerella dactyloides]|uniref:Uncharacterized protein n=1 Tax=Drechslerella dactyloides TaxID=74499 RepID=A0AAD6NMH1_DREDA|nr:hypothetical protein Dda_0194 [Drechslerella dactyloides]